MVEPTRRGALLDLVIMKNKELVRDMKVQESLGCSDCERMEVRILRGGSRGKKQDRALHFRKADLFRALFGRTSWILTWKGRRV